jgi:uncharacterized protein YbaP (TraB family)
LKLKKIVFSLAALLLFFSCISAPKGDTSSLLWKVSGNGLAEPSYIFGTHHLVPITFLDSVSGIHDAFENTAQTVGELDLGDMAQLQMKIMGEAVMPTGTTYETLLSATDIARLDSVLTRLLGVGLGQLGTMKPALLSNLISVTLYQQYYPSLASGKSLDQYFQEEALKRNRPVVGLESAEDQIYVLLNAQTLERQAEMLICMVNHPELQKEQMDKLQTAYHAQDTQALLDLYEKVDPNDPCPSTEEEKSLLNKDRNMRWLEKLPAIMNEKPSFIAVGCLHLLGKDGLIEGLRNLGYHVEAVK